MTKTNKPHQDCFANRNYFSMTMNKMDSQTKKNTNEN
jgi:hypothetical protein